MAFRPHFTISPSIASVLIAIERTRGFFEAAQLSEQWLTRMQAHALVLEAHHTTHIEGNQLTLDASEQILSGKIVPGADVEDVRELLNYTKAFDFVAGYISSQGLITEGLIREIHRCLVEGVRGDSAQPGQYRSVQNYVANSKTNEIIYTPPAAYDVPILMAELVTWLQHERSIPPVLVAGIAQFQLVQIHPFLDGNGRCARLLSTLCLYRSGYDFKRLFTISEYYDRNRQDYYQAIQSVREHNLDMTFWLEYFCLALATQMREIEAKASRVIKAGARGAKCGLSERQKRIVDLLLPQEHGFTIRDYEHLCPGVHRRTLQRDLADLVEKGFLVREGEKRNTRYRARNEEYTASPDQ